MKFEISPGNAGVTLKVFEKNNPIFSQNLTTSLEKPIEVGPCLINHLTDGSELNYSGSDEANLTIFINDKGDIVIPKAQQTNYLQKKTWGFKTAGTVTNQGESAFYGFFTQCRATHNLGILKTKHFKMVQDYIFNSGVIHSGDDGDTISRSAYTEYLALIAQNQTEHPKHTKGIFDDYGVTLIEGTLKIKGLTHRIHGLAQATQVILENSSVENKGVYIVKDTMTGTAPSVENHCVFDVGSIDRRLQAQSFINHNEMSFSRPTDIWAQQSFSNEGVLSSKSSISVGSQKPPKRFGIIQSGGGIRTASGQQMLAKELEDALDKCAFFSQQKVKLPVAQNTDHYLNTITDHYLVDQYGNKKYSHRSETGYQFQKRTTDYIEKEVDANSPDLPPALAKHLNERQASLKDIQKQLENLKKQLQQAGGAQGAFNGSLMDYLKTLGLNDDEIKSITGYEPLQSAFSDGYNAREMTNSFFAAITGQSGLYQLAGSAIQWAQEYAVPLFEQLLPQLVEQSLKRIPVVGPAISKPAGNYVRAHQGFNKAQQLLSKRHGSGKGNGPLLGSDKGSGTTPTQLQNVGRNQPERVINPSKSESSVWQNFKSYKGKTKTNGLSGNDKEFYQWDNTHKDIEVFNHNGKIHKGSMDPNTGKIIKPGKPGRTLDL